MLKERKKEDPPNSDIPISIKLDSQKLETNLVKSVIILYKFYTIIWKNYSILVTKYRGKVFLYPKAPA